VKFPGSIRSWARGASLALALAVIAGRSFAQGIIHYVPTPPLYYSFLLTSQDIDVNNDGTADYNLSTPDGIAINLTPLNNNVILSVLQPPPDIGAFIYALPAGTQISSSLNPALVWFDRNSTAGSLGYFQGNTDAYAGIRLETGGNYHYGWLHIQNLAFNAGQISDWAFESNPNTPIFAGAVPEPSTWSLFCGGFVLIVYLQRRNRRAVPTA
jgi:hypothetical protein